MPEFLGATTEYSLELPHDTATVTATPTATVGTTTITVQGEPVESGAESAPIAVPAEVTVVCTAADGVTEATYTVAVTVVPLPPQP